MGLLYASGYNGYGQLGLGNTTDRHVFTQVGTESWKMIAAGVYHTIGLKLDGTIWGTGGNHYSCLGLGDSTQRNSFVQIGSDSDWVYVFCGSWNSFAIKTDGSLYAWGWNERGQLGLGDFGEGTDRNVPTLVSNNSWVSGGAGTYETAAIRANGTMWSCGLNTYGAAGNGGYYKVLTQETTLRTDWSQVRIDIGNATSSSLAVTTAGVLYGAGSDANYRIGFGGVDKAAFTAVPNMTGVAEAYIGNQNSIVRKTDGTLWGCGARPNSIGFDDNNTALTAFTQVTGADAAGKTFTALSFNFATSLAIADSNLFAAGSNGYGEAGGGTIESPIWNEAAQVYGFTQIPVDYIFNKIVTGQNHTMALVWKPSRHKGNTSSGSVLFNGKQYVGDYANGKIYQLDMDTYTDDGLAIKRTRRTQIINKERVNVIHDKVEVDFEHGVGLNVASGVAGYDPQAKLKWSDDEGNTWSSGISISMGKYGEHETRAIWRRLGMSRNRIYELTIEEPVKTVITGSYADLKECRF